MESLSASSSEDPPDHGQSSSHGAAETTSIPAEAPFSSFAKEYTKRIFGLIMSRVYQREDSWDLTQETLKRAWRNFGKLEAGRDPWPWISEVANNVVNDFFRDRKTLKRNGKVQQLYDIEDDRNDPVRLAEKTECNGFIRASIQKLPRDDCTLLEQYYFEGQTAECIAKELGISMSALNSRLHRARTKLRKILEQSPEFQAQRNFASAEYGGIC